VGHPQWKVLVCQAWGSVAQWTVMRGQEGRDGVWKAHSRAYKSSCAASAFTCKACSPCTASGLCALGELLKWFPHLFMCFLSPFVPTCLLWKIHQANCQVGSSRCLMWLLGGTVVGNEVHRLGWPVMNDQTEQKRHILNCGETFRRCIKLLRLQTRSTWSRREHVSYIRT